jgi:HEAT repeat protein
MIPGTQFSKRPLADWVADLDQSPDAEVRYRALLAVQSLAAPLDGIEACRRALQDADSGVRALAAKQLGDWKRRATFGADLSWSDAAQELTVKLDDPDPDVRFESARALGRIEPSGSIAREVLLALVDDSETQPLTSGLVISALMERTESDWSFMLPRYRRLISHNQAEVREHASAGIVKLGRLADQLIPELVLALDDEEPIVRENAAHALGEAMTNTDSVRSALESACSDEDEGVAEAARNALARISSL